MKRKTTILLVLSLLASFSVAPGSAAKSRENCAPYKPVEPGPDSYSAQKDRALKAPVLQITDSHTEKSPKVIEFEQGPSFYAVHDPVIEDAKFFNIQAMTKEKVAKLNLRQEWAWPEPHDFDLLLFGSRGERVAESQNLSLLPTADPWNPDSGPGYEFIKDVPTRNCEGYTIESKGFMTPGATVRLKVWLK